MIIFQTNFWRRTWEIWVLWFGHALCSASLGNIASGLTDIQDSYLKDVLKTCTDLALFVIVNLHARIWFPAIPLIIVIGLLRGKTMRRWLDILSALLITRFTYQLICANIFLFSPVLSGTTLLVEIIVLIPLSTIVFGWAYWRLDSNTRRTGREAIKFPQPPIVFDYFHYAGSALFAKGHLRSDALTKTAKAITFFQGLILIDILALGLSRSIALAIKSSS